MALLYGTNFTASDMSKWLEQNDLKQNGIRNWRRLFGNASLGYNAQSGALRTDYSDVIAQAYKSNLAQQNAIASAGLNVGATNELMGLTQQDLHNTYRTYMSNYKQSLSSLNENYSAEVNALREDLSARAQNFADYFGAVEDYYYNHLIGSTHNGADYFADKGMDFLFANDVTGRRALAREELNDILFDRNGSITKEGIQFFDAITNATPYGYERKDGSGALSFDEWLSAENPELREWAASADEFNYNFAGTNEGTFNILSGRESTDEKYNRGEYIRGDDTVSKDYVKPWSEANSFIEAFDPDTHYEFYKSEVNRLLNYSTNDNVLSAAEAIYDTAQSVNVTRPKNIELLFTDPARFIENIGEAWDGKETSEYKDFVKRAEGAKKNYIDSMSLSFNELDTGFSDLLSSQQYNEFKSQYKGLFDEYDKLMKDANDGGYNNLYYSDIPQKLTKVINDIQNAMNKYLKEHQYTGKTSGY